MPEGFHVAAKTTPSAPAFHTRIVPPHPAPSGSRWEPLYRSALQPHASRPSSTLSLSYQESIGSTFFLLHGSLPVSIAWGMIQHD